MIQFSKYFDPACIDEVFDLLDKYPNAKILAGGTDLFLAMRSNGYKEEASVPVICLKKIQELTKINELDQFKVFIGPMARFTDIMKDPLMNRFLPMIKTAAASIAGPQIRNMATIGGNICNGATSADSAPPLFALDAMVTLQRRSAKRCVPIESFYLGPSQVDLRPGEILTGIVVSHDKNSCWGGDYLKYSMRKAMDIATLGCAVTCKLNADKTIKSARLVLGNAAPTPIYCKIAESILIGQSLSGPLLREVGISCAEAANPHNSWRVSGDYQRHLIRKLMPRMLNKVYQNIGGING